MICAALDEREVCADAILSSGEPDCSCWKILNKSPCAAVRGDTLLVFLIFFAVHFLEESIMQSKKQFHPGEIGGSRELH